MGINARTLRLRKALRCQVQLFGFENSASARSGERRSRTKFGAQIKFYAKKYFSLLPRLANAVASRHALPSSSRQSRGNFHYHNRGRGAASECQPNPLSLGPSSGSRIAGEEATRKEKRLVDIWIEGFAGQSDRDPYEQLAGCRSGQDEEAKK